jgi:two-component system, NarL family, sensor histidine kinase DegS
MGPPGPRVGELRNRIMADVAGIDRELSEIELLIDQVAVEAERNESRRARTEERVGVLVRDARATPAELNETHESLLNLTRRAMTFENQREVLEGKLKVLRRFSARLALVADALGPLAGLPLAPAPSGPPAAGQAGPGGVRPADGILQMRTQEELRRSIVRQLHDGPAQSLANIALHAEIVQRLVGRDNARAQQELVSMRDMVQHALDATKGFIFEVRPMVLDDLGLAPTLRRAAADRGQRAGIPVEFDSHGHERRLPPDLESGLFRCVDEAIAGYLAVTPQAVMVRLDWSETELTASVASVWPRPTDSRSASGSSQPAPAASDAPPPALAAMIEESRSRESLSRSAARAIAPERVAGIGERARALGVRLVVREEGRALDLVASLPA